MLRIQRVLAAAPSPPPFSTPFFSSSYRLTRSIFARVSLARGFLNAIDPFIFAACCCCCWGRPPPRPPPRERKKRRRLRFDFASSILMKQLLLSFFQGRRKHARTPSSFASMKGPSLALFCMRHGRFKKGAAACVFVFFFAGFHKLFGFGKEKEKRGKKRNSCLSSSSIE